MFYYYICVPLEKQQNAFKHMRACVRACVRVCVRACVRVRVTFVACSLDILLEESKDTFFCFNQSLLSISKVRHIILSTKS